MIERIVRRITWHPGASALVLLYHRIADEDVDPWGLCVSPRHFAEQLDVLRRHRRCLPLCELVGLARERRLPSRAVALTFDDGYADNLHTAVPLLEQADVTATVFIVSGAIGVSREFWWDELERRLLRPVDLPAMLEIELDGEMLRYSVAPVERSEAHARDRQVWRAGEQPPPSPRHALYLELWQRLKLRPADEQRRVLDALAAWAGDPVSVRRTHRALSEQEVGRLANSDLIDIGSHTVSHPVLPSQPVERQRHEIVRSKLDLERLCGRSIRSFSYPHGQHDGSTERLVEGSGFACACSVLDAAVHGRTDAFRLPRAAIGDWDGETFTRWLTARSG
jgi:peptidoglycan/xylan/chitin deacetylase (PgdA/CDA1 family)